MDTVERLPYDQRPANRDLSHLDGEYGWPLVGKTHFARLLFMQTIAEMVGNYRMEFAKESCFPPKLQYFPFSRPLDSLLMKLVLRT